MIHLLNNGKILLQVDDSYYEFIRQKSLAKNGGTISRFQLFDFEKLLEKDVLHKLEDKYIYCNTETDSIYMWTNIDENNNISDRIIWYEWINNMFDKINDDEYDDIINKYNNNKLRTIKDFYELYNSPDSDIESETISTDNDTSDSDFVLDDDELSDDELSDDESVPIEEELNENSELINTYLNYMANNLVDFRKEYVTNLINVANSISNLDVEKFKIVIEYLHKYYLI